MLSGAVFGLLAVFAVVVHVLTAPQTFRLQYRWLSIWCCLLVVESYMVLLPQLEVLVEAAGRFCPRHHSPVVDLSAQSDFETVDCSQDAGETWLRMLW